MIVHPRHLAGIVLVTIGNIVIAGTRSPAPPDNAGPGVENNAIAYTLAIEDIVGGLDNPAFVTAPDDQTPRLFVVELTGRIRIIDLLSGQVLAPPFLDVSALVSTGGERGLFSVAFHPDYANNGYFFVDYTDTAGDTVIARYEVSQGDPDVADPNSATILLTVDQPYANHNGGQLQFGPDGMLYIGMGDGGSGNDPGNRAQNPNTLLGKMLRLDVDNPPTYIPADNPFVDDPNTLDEIWALGLRNPWRFSFDRQTGDLYIGDVGQNAREEIDFEPAASTGGRNYGWDCREGTICTPTSSGGYGCDCNDPTLIDPILDIPHTDSGTCAITGGYVYRGSLLPYLSGTYFYADYCADYIRSFRYDGAIISEQHDWSGELVSEAGSTIQSIVSFGEDNRGELYIVSRAGTIHRITHPPADFDGDGDVDLADYGRFLDCYNGPTNAPPVVYCDTADFDEDGDVDLADYGDFLVCYNGPGSPTACP